MTPRPNLLLHVPVRLARVLIALRLATASTIGKTRKRKEKRLPLLEGENV
jgi:hypothetical protein